MISEKGLSESVTDRIGELVRLNGSIELIDRLLSEELGANKKAKTGLEALKLLFKYADIFKIKEVIRFDLSLARGLDYYTGIIYETVLTADDVECGSIAGGGRYDGLVGMLSDTAKWNVPCVGVSIGIERILAIIEKQMEDEVVYPTQVLIASIGKNMTEERMKILVDLWEANIRAEHSFKNNAKLLTQFQYCEDKGIPLAIIIGEDELKKGIIKIRNIKMREEVRTTQLFSIKTCRNILYEFCLIMALLLQSVFPRERLIQELNQLIANKS